uniref:Uncharacterized protein n=1 Tax=Oryza brachyantha TaxID=4533 RepID=J3N905_ORYBR
MVHVSVRSPVELLLLLFIGEAKYAPLLSSCCFSVHGAAAEPAPGTVNKEEPKKLHLDIALGGSLCPWRRGRLVVVILFFGSVVLCRATTADLLAEFVAGKFRWRRDRTASCYIKLVFFSLSSILRVQNSDETQMVFTKSRDFEVAQNQISRRSANGFWVVLGPSGPPLDPPLLFARPCVIFIAMGVWMPQLLADLRSTEASAFTLEVKYIVDLLINHDWSKHIATRYHYIREEGKLNVEDIVDLLTKPFGFEEGNRTELRREKKKTCQAKLPGLDAKPVALVPCIYIWSPISHD